ncbi:MAG TPA: GtrA family protein [Solirubrobacteraceae bacterium]|jgi:putative flippase GtrA|nr:GtrA family protein [Solirubrobacteraceae bacterium]
MEMLAGFIRKHPWWQWLTRTPFSAKMTKYALSSVIAFGLSEFAFAFCYWLGLGTIGCSVIAFFAAAIPNWIMNRRWAWQQKGRPPAKQTIAYVTVSIVVLVVTSVATKLTNYWVKNNVVNHHGLRILIVTGSFTVVTVILFFAKFAVYEFLIFSDERRGGGPQDGGPRRGRRARRGEHVEREPESEPALSSGPNV